MAALTNLSFAIAGTGAMGLEHIRNISLLRGRGATIVAVADSDARARDEARKELDGAGFKDATIFDDVRKLYECGADAFIVCTPNFAHAALLREILPLEKFHVLCEKPMCTTVADCLDVEALVKKHCASHRLFCVGMEYRWMPPIARLVEEVDSGALGETKMVSIVEHRFPFLHKVGHWNRFNKFTGGTLVEKACHFFDLMRRLMKNEDPATVYAAGGGGVNHRDETYDGEGQPDILDYAHCIVTFPSGATAALDLCMFAEDAQNERVSVVGTKGKATATCPECTFRVVRRSAKAEAPGRTPPAAHERSAPKIETVRASAEVEAAGFHEGATYYELQAFCDAALAGGPPPVSARDGTMAVVMGVAAHASLDTGRAVAVADILAEGEKQRAHF